MKILDAGHQPLSNADVLDWVKRKRAQHAREDAEDQKRHLPPARRPANFIRILNRTERELSADKHPYTLNPSAYLEDSRSESFTRFALEAETAVQDHVDAEWKDRVQAMSPEEREKTYAEVQEKKCLSKAELLVIFNHAPTCVEMLQPMIELVDDRFTAEEQQLIVDVVLRMLRPDQKALQSQT